MRNLLINVDRPMDVLLSRLNCDTSLGVGKRRLSGIWRGAHSAPIGGSSPGIKRIKIGTHEYKPNEQRTNHLIRRW